jgi:hypothetical protein
MFLIRLPIIQVPTHSRLPIVKIHNYRLRLVPTHVQQLNQVNSSLIQHRRQFLLMILVVCRVVASVRPVVLVAQIRPS